MHQCWDQMTLDANLVDDLWVRHGDFLHQQSNKTYYSIEKVNENAALNLPHPDWTTDDYIELRRIHTDALHKYLQFFRCPHV